MSKNHCTLGFIANDEQINNNLFQAISKVCSSTSTPQPSFETASRKYTIFNMISDADFVNYSIMADAFVLIIDATKGATKKMRDFLSFAPEMIMQRQASLYADRRRLLNHWPRHCRYWTHPARHAAFKR